MSSSLPKRVVEVLGPGGVISRRLPGYESRPSQVAMAETIAAAIDAGQHAVIEGGTGVGKALDVDTPIATPTGWKRMGDLCVGDLVFDETGAPTEVIRAFDVMYDRPCYEIEFSDGSILVADENHQWITCTWRDRKRLARQRDALPFSRLTTRDIATTLTVIVGNVARLNHAVPIAHALKLPDRDLPLASLILGLWLGDGHANCAQLSTADPEIIHEVEGLGYIVRKLTGKYHYSLHLSSGPALNRWEPSVTGVLRDLGVLKNKHIPLCYMRASERQRRALLAGLLDTDGTVSPQGAIQYTSTNPRLACDVQALVLSLGYRPSMMTKPARLYGKDCGTSYTIHFTTCDEVFRLPRKVAAHKQRSRNYTPARNTFRYITAVRPVPSRPVRCIQVTAASHLYLAGESLIPTHNSLAYLVPAIYSGKRVIVSTANKALQDQLVGKDIPFLQHTLPRDVSAALVKGRSNYLCLERFGEEEQYQTMAGQTYDYRALKAWAAATTTGDFEEMDMLPGRDLLARASSTTRTCIGTVCGHFHDCFVEKMRARAEASQLVVCNHALLLADLVVRDMGAYLLPDRDVVIIDEAHRLEEAAFAAFTVSLSRRDITELVEHDALRRHAGTERVAALPVLADRLFRRFERPTGRGRDVVTDELTPGLALAQGLAEIAEHLTRHNPHKAAPAATPESRRYEKLVAWTARLAEDARLVSRANDKDSVRYVEYRTVGHTLEVTLKWTPIDVGEPLAEILFRQSPVVCTSATLAVGDFAYFRHAVGIDEAAEFVAPSPFDYPAQCLLYVPAHLPEFRATASPEYTAALCREIEGLVRASGGRAFLLFTSYRGMEDAYKALRDALPYTLLKQGELPRGELLRRFRADGSAVLFATKSFWEGVDVVGEALSLVVIDRMPFSVPDDPVVATRVNRLKEDGGDWFNDLMLPTAILQLKQGVGRLIRSNKDRGVVAILDSRLARKGYGRRVIAALPPARLARRMEDVEAFFAAGVE
jgi:Rad3-related DNA helicase